MKRASLAASALFGFALSAAVAARGAEPPAPDLFREQITPVLQRCVGCHAGETPAGGLNLTTRALALKGGESGPALQPGDAAKSLLFAMASSKAMPPKKPLRAEEIDALRRWIQDGAAWDGVIQKPAATPVRAGQDWWALQPVRRPEPPAVKNKDWVRNPIDAFVLAELEKRRLKPTPPADRATLLRRVTYDLHGLPPTPAEIDAFLADQAPDAYEKVLDRLLASPRYGERWGRHWLDVARYGESNGFERDQIRDHAWRYRDYVIKSFNDDKPYPQFVREQLAGDVLEPVGADGIVATGFLTCGPWDEVGNNVTASAILKLRVREEELEEMLALVGQTFLGLTLNCARCHDHKFDPIPQRDYYRLKAVFDGVRFGDRSLLTPEQARQREAALAKFNRRIADLERQLADLEQSGRAAALREFVPPKVEGVPAPLARWTFESDAKDAVGSMHGTLKGGAVVENGRLKLSGKGAFVQTAPLPHDVREKALEAWVALADLKQRGGGVLTLESKDGREFDAVAYGERVPKKWQAGSDFFRRTKDLAGADESLARELVHVAVVYGADDRIAVYRNGVPYAEAYTPAGPNATLRSFKEGEARVLLGLRHTGAGNGFLAGEIAEARLYDKALSAEQVAASFKAGTGKVPLQAILRRLTPEQRGQRERLLADLAKERNTLRALPAPGQAWAAVPSPPGPTHLLQRGDVEKKGEQVTAGALSAVKTPAPDLGLDADAPEGTRRRKLAEWIVSKDNPLTARVMANRIWHYHFGRGIVATPSDFGFNGERPTHPQLLDWLASEFVANGWSVKKLHKLILLSATYRQGAAFDAEAAKVDADNRFLWRFAPRRLEGEAVRDALLAVSGQLNDAAGGPGFRPFTVTIFNSHFYTLTDPATPEFNRRTVYRIHVHSAKSPLLEAFDCPDPGTKTPRRVATTTPLQALGMMNNAFVLRQARYFAERVKKEAGEDPADQVKRAYRLASGRPPTAAETERAAALAKEHGLETLCWVLLNASEFVYVR